MAIRVTLHIPRLPIFDPEAARRILQQEIGQGMSTVLEAMATMARSKVRVDRGIVRGAIFTKVTPRSGAVLVTGTLGVGSQAPYAPYVEYGTAPHWVPIAPLKGWARRVLGDERAAYAVQRAIARRGTKAHPFLQPAFDAGLPRAQDVLQAALERAARRLGPP